MKSLWAHAQKMVFEKQYHKAENCPRVSDMHKACITPFKYTTARVSWNEAIIH